jgi:Ricin-type beta-trefoil lectin domain/Putative Ig domain
MRLPIRPGRSRVLAIAASVLLAGAAVAAATVPAEVAAASAHLAASGVTVTSPGATTAPVETPIALPLTAADTDAAGYPLSWSATGLAALGLSIARTNTNGTDAAITGIVPAAAAGTSASITVTATDGEATPADGTATFTLTLANTVTVTNPGAQSSSPGAVITPLAIAAKDTDAGATLTYAAADLPTGLAINPATGVITGEPTTAGVTDVTVTVTDDTGATGAATFKWTIGDKITVTAPKAEATWLGLKVSVQATAADSDKSEATTWSAKPLPPGLSINEATGLISGRTTATGAFKTVVTATDATGAAGTATIGWTVGTPITVSSPGSVTAVAGRSVAYRLAYKDVVRGDKVTWTATGLPAGVGFQQSSLLLYGWPTPAGTHTVVFKAKGSLGTSDQRVLKLVVKAAPNTGAAGPLRLALDGKCLQDPGNRTANGTRVELENCVSGATERWTLASDNTIRANGHCLNIAGSGTSNARQLQLWGCTGGPRQVWLQGSAGELVNPASGLCVTEASRNNGVTPTMGACRARSSEQWALPAQPMLTPVGGLCADDPLGVGTNGTVVDMYTCNGTPGQAWEFEANGMIRISQYANVCLTLEKSKPELWVCNAGNKDQRWSVNRAGGLGSELTVGGVCLATTSLTAFSTTKLVVAKCSAANPLDLWHIE